MSDEKRKKLASTNSLLPSINYKQIISLVVVLLVTLTSPSSQTPLASQYDCPQACECNESQLSAKCSDIDALISAYSIKHHPTRKNFMPIKILDLSNNQLTKISNQLELLVNLTELNLSHNRLTQVHKLHFEHLETLDLSNNRITSAKLSKLPKNVIHLNLSHNEITYLPSDFMKLKKLRSLELSENPLNCTCETLMIRNWIQYQHVWTDKVIICASPQVFKGQPWVQARQNDICIETSSTTQASKYNWDEYENDNEVMMGDDPNAGSPTDSDVTYDDGDNDEGHVPIGNNSVSRSSSAEAVDEEDPNKVTEKDLDIFNESSEKMPAADENDLTELPDEFGSDGIMLVNSSVKPIESEITSEPSEEGNDDEDSGSGDDTSYINGAEASSSVPSSSDNDDSSGDSSGDHIILDISTPIGIFVDETTTVAPLAPGLQKNVLDPVDGAATDSQLGAVDKASSSENNGTYILLAAIGILLVSLIAFVAMQNRKEKRNSRRNYDVEKEEGRNGGTELQDMDKALLGKPIEKNGNGKHENSPLIGNYEPPAITVDEPLQDSPRKDKSQQSLYENNLPNGNGNAFEPIEPVHATPSNGGVPRSPDSDEEVFHPATDNTNGPESLNVSPEPPKRYSPIYSPTSPRSARYSPVYSPETGRVKIKLTETPKPKTPVVVTRSRSRAGDGYVNTPNN